MESSQETFYWSIRRGVAYLRDTRLHLTHAEFDLLRYLLAHDRNIATGRTVLSTSAVDSSGVRQAKFLETLLSLKWKLAAAAPGASYLRTEPWVLYSFSPTLQGTSRNLVNEHFMDALFGL